MPQAQNEPIKTFMKNSPERIALEKRLAEYRSTVTEIPIVIGGKEIKTGNMGEVRIPHEHKTVIARYHKATPELAQVRIPIGMKSGGANLHNTTNDNRQQLMHHSKPRSSGLVWITRAERV